MESESTANHTSLVVAGRRPLPPVRQTSLDAYIRAVNSIPILSAEEEKSLAEDYQKTGNVESAQKLVVSQLRFVVHIARSYLGYGLPLADLIQEVSCLIARDTTVAQLRDMVHTHPTLSEIIWETAMQ